jgi:hypothetical protein
MSTVLHEEEITTGPCQACGRETDRRVAAWKELTPQGTPTGGFYGAGICDECATLNFDEPGAAVRAALRLLGKDEADWEVAAEAFRDAGVDVTAVFYGRRHEPQRKPWGHVPREAKAALRAGYVRVLDAKVHAASSDHDRPVPPTSPPDDMPQGCLVCGIGKSTQWNGPLTTFGLAPGSEPVTGCLCVACVAVLREVGAVGEPLIERAAMEFVDLEWSDAVRIPELKAWIATGLPPREVAWDWVELTPPQPALDPMTELRIAVADLRIEVAALRAEVGA